MDKDILKTLDFGELVDSAQESLLKKTREEAVGKIGGLLERKYHLTAELKSTENKVSDLKKKIKSSEDKIAAVKAGKYEVLFDNQEND